VAAESRNGRQFDAYKFRTMFTNGDEIINYMTLPGYSCDNYFDAIGALPCD